MTIFKRVIYGAALLFSVVISIVYVDISSAFAGQGAVTCDNAPNLSYVQAVSAIADGSLAVQFTPDFNANTVTANINNTTGCAVSLSLGSYRMFGPYDPSTLSTQIFFDGTPTITLAPNTTSSLTVSIPLCMSQYDLWYGDVHHQLVNNEVYGAFLKGGFTLEGQYCTNVAPPLVSPNNGGGSTPALASPPPASPNNGGGSSPALVPPPPATTPNNGGGSTPVTVSPPPAAPNNSGGNTPAIVPAPPASPNNGGGSTALAVSTPPPTSPNNGGGSSPILAVAQPPASPNNGGGSTPTIAPAVISQYATTPPAGGGSWFAPQPIIKITKTPNPTALTAGPGAVTYTYAVTNTGVIPINNITVTDDKCSPVTFVSGDTNGDLKLDLTETWIFQCKTVLAQTTLNTATAHGNAYGWDTFDTATATVPVTQPAPVATSPIIASTGAVSTPLPPHAPSAVIPHLPNTGFNTIDSMPSPIKIALSLITFSTLLLYLSFATDRKKLLSKSI